MVNAVIYRMAKIFGHPATIARDGCESLPDAPTVAYVWLGRIYFFDR